MNRIIGLAAILLVWLVACTDFDRAFGGWVGHHQDELVTQWGPPYASHEMSDGRHLLTYSTQRDKHIAGPGVPVPFNVSYWCEVTYVTDPDGIIVSWDSAGNLGGCNTLLKRKGMPPSETE